MDQFEEEVVSFLIILNKHNVRFILVGGVAVNYYGYSRTTGDIDLWLDNSQGNREQLVKALDEFGVEGAETFLTYPLVAGYAEILLNSDIYVDLMSDLLVLKSDNFDECFHLAESFSLNENLMVKFLHINKLIEEKEKSKRAKDIDDAIQLRKLLNKRKD